MKETTALTEIKRERRYDLDWLRVLAIILLLYFHTGMVFINWTWYFMQDTHTSEFFNHFTAFLSHWRMPLLFFISGAGTLFALGYRSGFQYVKERMSRLLIPLIFGILIIIPPQIYYELIKHGREFVNYIDFNAQYFKGGLYPLGDFSWHHLWFIGYLFLFSLIALPAFLYLRSERGKKVVDKIAHFFEPAGRIYLMTIPLFIVQILLRNKFSGFHNLVDDMANFAFFFLFFFYGFLVCSGNGLWDSIARQRRTSLIVAVSSFGLLFIGQSISWVDFGYYPYWALDTVIAWSWVMAILGYGKRYLNTKSRILNYANEGIYPFYILHQTVLIILAYYVIQWETPVLVKYFVLSTATLIICILIYDLLIKRNNITRVLFGMKPLRNSPL